LNAKSTRFSYCRDSSSVVIACANNNRTLAQVVRDKVAKYFAAMDMSPPMSPQTFRAKLDHLADDIQLMK
jgi:hypothetical protein